MPPLGIVIGGVNFTGLKLTLKAAEEGVAGVTLNYGIFIQSVIDFTIVAFAIFLLVKGMNAIRRKQEAAPVAAKLSKQEELLTEIRDVLKESSPLQRKLG